MPKDERIRNESDVKGRKEKVKEYRKKIKASNTMVINDKDNNNILDAWDIDATVIMAIITMHLFTCSLMDHNYYNYYY